MFGIPFAFEGPSGCKPVELGIFVGLFQIVSQPTTMAAFATTVIIIGANTPWTGVEHLVAVGIADVVVQDVLRHLAVDNEELGVVMIATELGRGLGVEHRVGDD